MTQTTPVKAATPVKNPFEKDFARLVLLVPAEEFHRERTLELLQEQFADIELPIIAHQIRLGRIGDKIVIPVVAFATRLGERKQPVGWKLHIGPPLDCDKLLPRTGFDDESDIPPDYGAFLSSVQRGISAPVKNQGPSYQTRISEDRLLRLVSA